MCGTLFAKTVAVIQQGAQYFLPFRIRQKGVVISPENTDDVKIKVNDVSKRYLDGGLSYSGGAYLFPLTQEDTLSYPDDVKCQVAVKRGDNVYPSPTYKIQVGRSIFGEEF